MSRRDFAVISGLLALVWLTPAAASADMFHDDFEDGVLDGWTAIGPYQPWKIVGTPGARVLDANQRQDDKLNYIQIDDHAWGDLHASFRFHHEWVAGSSGGASLVLHNQPEVIPPALHAGKHYSVGFSGGYVIVARLTGFTNGGEYEGSGSYVKHFRGGGLLSGWNDVLVELTGNVFDVWLNGKHIVDSFEVPGEVVPIGAAGLLNHYAHTQFDDVSIVPEPSALILLTLGTVLATRRGR